MIKITLKLKDIKYRKNFAKVENQYKLYKAIQSNLMLPFLVRYQASLKIMQFGNASISKTVNRCIFTNRGRGVVRPFNISRHELKRQGLNKEIPGIKKSSW